MADPGFPRRDILFWPFFFVFNANVELRDLTGYYTRLHCICDFVCGGLFIPVVYGINGDTRKKQVENTTKSQGILPWLECVMPVV